MDFTKIRNYLFLGSLFLVTAVFLWLLKPFAYPLFWAAVIAGIFYPTYKRIDKFLRHPNLSTTITLSLVIVIIIVPLLIVGTLLFTESLEVYNSLSSGRGQFSVSLQNFASFLKNNRFIAELGIDQELIVNKISEAGTYLVNFVFTGLRSFAQNSIVFVIMFLLMLYSLFFFIRDGEKILKKIMYLLPLGNRYEKMLYEKFTSAARATLKGTLVLGTIQGTLGAILFAVAGIPGAVIWGIIMIALSLIPGVGASIIWAPAGLFMLITGNTWQGILILLVGVLIISTIDNLLRPYLVGKDLQMHPLIVLFSTLGGIALFGISGFVIGPIFAALFLSFWDLYEQYYHAELKSN